MKYLDFCLVALLTMLLWNCSPSSTAEPAGGDLDSNEIEGELDEAETDTDLDSTDGDIDSDPDPDPDTQETEPDADGVIIDGDLALDGDRDDEASENDSDMDSETDWSPDGDLDQEEEVDAEITESQENDADAEIVECLSGERSCSEDRSTVLRCVENTWREWQQCQQCNSCDVVSKQCEPQSCGYVFAACEGEGALSYWADDPNCCPDKIVACPPLTTCDVVEKSCVASTADCPTISPLTIPEKSGEVPGQVSSVLAITEDTSISHVCVAVDITSAYPEKLRLTLKHAGVETDLYSMNSHLDQNIKRQFIVEDDFDQVTSVGDWELQIQNEKSSDQGLGVGSLNCWDLSFNCERECNAINTPADLALANGQVQSTLTIEENQVISGLCVDLDFSIEQADSLLLTLTSPDNTKAVLDYYPMLAPGVGQFTYFVPYFDGEAAKGEWTLDVAQMSDAPAGWLECWNVRPNCQPAQHLEGCGGAPNQDIGQICINQQRQACVDDQLQRVSCPAATQCHTLLTDSSSIGQCDLQQNEPCSLSGDERCMPGLFCMRGRCASCDAPAQPVLLADNDATETGIAVTDSGAAGGLCLSIDAEHDAPEELTVSLRNPAGQSVELRSAGDTSQLRGIYAISDWAELDREGLWTLIVADGVEGNSGLLNCVTLEFNCP